MRCYSIETQLGHALTRRQLNGRLRDGAFPLGTFAANVLGSLVMALLFYGTKNSSSLTSGWSNVAIKAFQVRVLADWSGWCMVFWLCCTAAG